ncbi:WD40/YVTN/BNR-like repeat-containing protein [Neptunomonas concharum]|nr:YCF48-related protein [Neptunomonas concharum]
MNDSKIQKKPASYRLAVMLTLPVVMGGCEAKLDLSGIGKELENPIRRTDQFQALAHHTQQVVAVGNQGVILAADVNSLNWRRTELPGQPGLIDVDACEDGRFIALSFDRTLWTSTDGAQSWQPQSIPTSENLLDLTCSPDNSIWAVGSFSTVMVSKDHGKSWQESTLNEDAMLTGIQFLTKQTAYLTGEFGLVFRTDDAGKNWFPLEPIPEDFYPQAAFFQDRQHGWVVGLDGRVMATRDAGESWERQTSGTVAPLYGVTGGKQRVAVGENGVLLKNDTSGDVWQSSNPTGISAYIRDALWLNDKTLLLAGGNGTLKTLSLP